MIAISTTTTGIDHSTGMWVTRDDPDADVPGDDGEVAVREVDHLHDAEHQRQAAREQRVQAAGQHALDDGVNPGHYARSIPSFPGGRGSPPGKAELAPK